MTIENKISNLRVLVTRPSPAGETLCEKIQELGGISYHLPTIEIRTYEKNSFVQRQIAELNRFEIIVFVSPQAVYAGHRMIRRAFGAIPDTIKVAAMGEGTAKALMSVKIKADYIPLNEWNSEGLLELEVFKNISDKQIALIQGEKARPYLQDELMERGASVTSIEVYHRVVPTMNIDKYADLIAKSAIDVVVCTSAEGLRNFKYLLRDSWKKLQNIPVIVISKKMSELAQELGFKKNFMVKNASDDVIIEFLSGLFI